MGIGTLTADSLVFGTNNSERLTINSAGSVRFAAYGAGTLTTDASGNITASSDERLKTINGSFDRGLEELLELDPIRYHWNAASGLDRTTQYAGFSAQNVQGVIPEAVDVDPRGFLSLQDRPILAASVNAIKELAGRTTTLSLATSSLSVRLASVEEQIATPFVLPDVLTASVVRTGSLEATGAVTALRIEADNFVSARRYFAPATEETFAVEGVTQTVTLPSEVLATGGAADIYKLATYGLARTQALESRFVALAASLETALGRLDSIEAMIAAQTASSSAPTDTTSFADLLSSIGIAFDRGITSIKDLAAETFIVGTSEKPTGITLYDEETGEPYCFSIKGGKERVRAGECGEEPEEEEETPTPQPPAENTGGAGGTGTTTPEPTPEPVPAPEPAPEPEAPEPAPEPEPIPAPEPPPAPEVGV
jgi:hypothetical protein